MRTLNSSIVWIFFLIVTLSPSHLIAESIPLGERTTVSPLDLSSIPSKRDLMAAGQLGGTLYPTREIRASEKTDQSYLSFGQAIQAWNKHDYQKAVLLFQNYIKDFPDSPWVAESVLHIGCDARYNGRYSEAEESFKWILERNKDNNHFGAKILRNKARSRLAVLKVLQNNLDEAVTLFTELKKDSPDWRHRTYASHWIQRLSRYKAKDLAQLKCGTLALAQLLKNAGRDEDSLKVLEINPVSFKGQSLRNLQEIATNFNFPLSTVRLSVSELNEIPLPAIIHINGRDDSDKGHYWIVEHFTDGRFTILDPQIPRRFKQSPHELEKEWNGVAVVLAEGKDIPGGTLSAFEMEETYGGCCGVQRPEDNLGQPGDSGKAGVNNETNSCGSPSWNVNMINMNLFVTDTPLWYISAYGPSVKIELSYNSQSSIAYNEPFGNKWSFNYASYLVVDTGDVVTVFMPDGRRDSYISDGQGGYVAPYQVFNKIEKIAENYYELKFPDGTVYVYNIPQGTTSIQPFLVEIHDPYGQSLQFGYDEASQLNTITDALGQNTILTYNADGLITQISDPFGRTADFEYDTERNLTRITDMGGYWTAFNYDEDVYLTKIGNNRGEWDFKIEPADGIIANSDNYPPPDDAMWENYRITITNPLGEKEEYFYYGGCDEYTCDGYTWYVSPRDYIPWSSQTINNFRSKTPKTRYFLVQTSTGLKTEIGEILSPEGKNLTYSFDTNGNRTGINDSHGHERFTTYNSRGRVTSKTDAKGTLTTTTYAANEVDLLQSHNSLGNIDFTYNDNHAITSISDRMSNTTSYSYNSYGQQISELDPLNVVNEYSYDTDQRLQQLSRAGQSLESYTYDLIGRIKTYTDATGLTLAYDYNDLNNIIKTTYPDGKYTSYTYSDCCPYLLDSETDRSGRTTTYTYDALKRLVKTTNPEGGISQFEYDANGNKTRLVDANNNATSFRYDLDNRLIEKSFPDGNTIAYEYDKEGLLIRRTNSRGISASYSYDENHNLLNTSYSDDTPSVTYQYDSHNRIIEQQDGSGTYQFDYDANSHLTSQDGPWVDDTLTYSYDELGRRRELAIQNGYSQLYTYDPLNRVTNIELDAGNYSYTYSGASPFVLSLVRPNGSVSSYQYDPLNRLTEISNTNGSSGIITRNAYTYNAQDMRLSETITNASAITSFQNNVKTYNYNKVNQLLSSTNPAETFIHDDDGNMANGYTPDGYFFTGSYDAENRLISIEHTDGGGLVHKTEYSYNGDHLIALATKYENGSLVSTVRFVRDGRLSLQERDVDNEVVREFAWGLGAGGGIGGLLDLKQNGNNYSYLYDGRGNITALLDASQAVTTAYRYDAFGNLMSSTGAIDQPYKFSTKPFNATTGLSYYGYRFYSPVLGRWLTRDPIGEEGGENLFVFVQNNPINFFDHFGMEAQKQNILHTIGDLIVNIVTSAGTPETSVITNVKAWKEIVKNYPQTAKYMIKQKINVLLDKNVIPASEVPYLYMIVDEGKIDDEMIERLNEKIKEISSCNFKL